jgi:hypothetical protein
MPDASGLKELPMKKAIASFAIGLLTFLATCSAQAAPKPLRAVVYVGGGFHDYKTMPGVLTGKLSALINATFDIKPMDSAQMMAAAFNDPKFGEGYDVIVYDICFGEKWEDGDYDGAIKAASKGTPAVFVHCSMHTYRPPRNVKDPKLTQREAIADAKWHALVGMDTRVHDKFQAFSTEKAAPGHPILKTFPDHWSTPGDELYNTVKMMPTATPLLTAKSPSSDKTHTVAWVNQYGTTRVFCTTLGHDMKTGADADYQRLLAYGLLWACDKLGTDGKPAAGYGGTPRP